VDLIPLRFPPGFYRATGNHLVLDVQGWQQRLLGFRFEQSNAALVLDLVFESDIWMIAHGIGEAARLPLYGYLPGQLAGLVRGAWA
jgi:hypothetical protein